jgi:hypothetical protein
MAALAFAIVAAGGSVDVLLGAPSPWLPVVGAAVAVNCEPPSGWQSTKAAPVPGVPSDFDLKSFDGTTIQIHWFPDTSADGANRPSV